MKLNVGKCAACGKLITEAESRLVFHVACDEDEVKSEVVAVLQYHSAYGQPTTYACEPAIRESYTENGTYITVLGVQGYTLDVMEGFRRYYTATFAEEAANQMDAIREGYYLAKAHERPDPMPGRHHMRAERDANYPAIVRSAITKFSNVFEKRSDYVTMNDEYTDISLVRVYRNTFEKCVMLHYDLMGEKFSREIPSVCMKYVTEQDLTFLTLLKKLCGSKTRDMVEMAQWLNDQLDKVADPFTAIKMVRMAIDTKSINVKANLFVLASALADLIGASEPMRGKRKM
jgi:hypothetical protein